MNLRIDDSAINDLQRASIRDLRRQTKGAHFINIRIRINGQWREIEADWLGKIEVVE